MEDDDKKIMEEWRSMVTTEVLPEVAKIVVEDKKLDEWQGNGHSYRLRVAATGHAYVERRYGGKGPWRRLLYPNLFVQRMASVIQQLSPQPAMAPYEVREDPRTGEPLYYRRRRAE